MEKAKVALVHDWLTGQRGGEKVLEIFTEIFSKTSLGMLLYLHVIASTLCTALTAIE